MENKNPNILKLQKSNIITDNLGQISTDNQQLINKILQNLGDSIQTFGYNKTTQQILFRLLLKKDQQISSQLESTVSEIIEPADFSDKINLKAICIYDYNKGFNGRYSLVEKNNKFGIVQELDSKQYLVKDFNSFKNLSDALNYISKNLYFKK